jgi:hypothetical protein
MNQELKRTPFCTMSVRYVSDLIKKIDIPDFQRESDIEHIEKIYSSVSNDIHNNNEPKLTGCLITVSTPEATYLLDGNHRAKAYKRLLDDGHDLKIYVQEIETTSKAEAEKLFNQLNNSLPVAQMPSGVKRSLVNDVVAFFYKKYNQNSDTKGREPLFKDTPSSNVNRPRISKSRFESAVAQVLDLGIDSETFISKLDKFIEELNHKTPAYFKHGGHDTYKKLQVMLEVADMFRCRLGMFLTGNYFADLSRVMGIESSPAVITVERIKSYIPKALRWGVWDRYCGKHNRISNCPFCGSEIRDDNFHCAHEKAASLGGETSIDNLYPCCATCNLSMGVKTFEDFRKHWI